MSEFAIQGLDAVRAKLQAVSREVAQKGARAAGTRAMRIVRDAARRNAQAVDDPETASNIPKAITTRFDSKASKRQGAVVVKVGVVGGGKLSRDPANVGHFRLIEFGTSQMPARPFLRPALSGNIQAVTEKFVSELIPQIDKALAKAR